MKIVLSRKGFDSESGKLPSPILDDGRMWSLPIPSRGTELREGCSRPRYNDIRCGEIPMGALVSDLTHNAVKGSREAHLDPDLNSDAIPRASNWIPIFGQSDKAESHLRNQGVGPGDVFLFFGTFCPVEFVDGRFSYQDLEEKRHVLFGWLQIENRYPVAEARRSLPWATYHPHLCRKTPERNDTVYVAAKHLVVGGRATSLPGGGVFGRFHEDLVLSAPRSKISRWKLPVWFQPKYEGHKCLTYHGASSCWHPQDDHVILKTVSRGQEFVFDTTQYNEAEQWLLGLLGHADDRSGLPLDGKTDGHEQRSTNPFASTRKSTATVASAVRGELVSATSEETRMNKGRETVTFEVKKAYLQNGYLYIKDKLRHHFPKPDAQITLLQPGHAGELTRTVKLVIPDRWRIVGLGDWFTSNDVKAGDKVVLEVVESRQTYRIRRVPTGEDA